MGRGGEKTVTPPPQKPLLDAASTISSTIRPSKAVEALPTEVLHKKAVQYGIDTSADRATLLRELVSAGWWRVGGWMNEHVCMWLDG
jgi:hypothetical protein